MKQLAMVALLATACGTPVYENNGTSGSSGSTGTVVQGITVSGTRRAPAVMFVVDRSGSMADAADDSQTDVCPQAGNLQQNCKWDALLNLMVGDGTTAGFAEQVQDHLSSASQQPAELGLITFSANDVCAPGAVQVALGADHAGTVVSVLETVAPKGGTPTAATLGVAEQAMLADADAGPRDAYVILLTDGAPNCNPQFVATQANCSPGTDDCVSAGSCFGQTGAPLGCLDADGSVTAVQNLADIGVPTFVIGFGADFQSGNAAFQTLDRMAQAGGVALSGEPAFYQASNASDLASSFDAIGAQLQHRCAFDLETAAPSTFGSLKLVTGAGSSTLANGSFALSGDRKQLRVIDDLCAQPSHAAQFVFE